MEDKWKERERERERGKRDKQTDRKGHLEKMKES